MQRPPLRPPLPEAPLDLSKIDFEKLRTKFEQGLKRAEAERLRGGGQQQATEDGSPQSDPN